MEAVVHKRQDVIKFSILAICSYVHHQFIFAYKWRQFFLVRHEWMDGWMHGHVRWQKEMARHEASTR